MKYKEMTLLHGFTIPTVPRLLRKNMDLILQMLKGFEVLKIWINMRFATDWKMDYAFYFRLKHTTDIDKSIKAVKPS